MKIEKMNPHYSFTNPASVYDEEALTALELAGRQAAKVNEVIEALNTLESNLFAEMDKAVETEVKDYVSSGEFDKAIEEHIGDLETRVDNIVSGGSANKDAEVVDMRMTGSGVVYPSAGDSLRDQIKDAENSARAIMYFGAGATYEWGTADEPVGGVVLNFPSKLTLWSHRWTGEIEWNQIDSSEVEKLNLVVNSDGSAQIVLPAYSAFAFNVYTRKFYMRNGSKGNVGDILLLFNTHHRITHGCLWSWFVWKQVNQNAADIVVNRLDAQRSVAYSRAGYVYSGISNHVEFTTDYVNNALLVRCPKPLARFTSMGSGSIPWDTATSAIAANVVIDGEVCTFTLPNYTTLVFSENSDKYYIRNGGTINYDEIPLVQNTYCFPLRGTLVDEWGSKIGMNGGTGSGSDSSSETVSGDTAASIQAAFDDVKAAAVPVSDEASWGDSWATKRDCDKIMFFTDPHLCEGEDWAAGFAKYKQRLKAAFEAFAPDFVFCGGDWLGNSDTIETARAKLAFINGQMRAMFGDKYCPILGNHDTNYQGISTEGAEANTGTLVKKDISMLWDMPTRDKCYYSIESDNGYIYVVFDTWTDRDVDTDEAKAYWGEQLDWFINILNAHKADEEQKTVIILMHQIWMTETTLHPLADAIRAYAFNAGHFTMAGEYFGSARVNLEKGSGTPVCPVIFGGHLHSEKQADYTEDSEEKFFVRCLARPSLKNTDKGCIDLVWLDGTSSNNSTIHVTPFGGTTTTHSVPRY